MIYKRKDEVARELEEQKKNPVAAAAGGNRGKSARRQEGGEEEAPPKFTSTYEEYRAGYWRRVKREKVYVTIDTVVPSMPKNIMESPDETAYHKVQAEQDEKIDAINAKTKELGERFTERLA